MINKLLHERRIAISIGGGFMEKIDLPFFYELGSQLNPIATKEYSPEERFNMLFDCFLMRMHVTRLFSSFPVLNVCRDAKNRLDKSIDEIWDWYRATDKDKLFEPDDKVDTSFKNIIANAKEFEIVLSAELQTIAAYHITQKGIYSTTDLIERGECLLPESTLPKVSKEIKEEIRQSGRCLVFDSGTACAFHIIRALELIMHEYYINISKPKPKRKGRLSNWGEYIKAFQNSAKPEAKEVAVLLQQIKDQHRNLIMHPETTLSVDEAFALFEMAKGVIIIIATKLPVFKKK